MRNLRALNSSSCLTRTTTWADDGAGAGAGEGTGGAGAGAGAGAADKPFYEAFTDDTLKTSAAIQRYKDPEALAKGYVELEKRYGIDPARRIDLPADPNDKDGMMAVYDRLGRPKTPDEYGFKLDDKATDADKGFLARATKAFHDAGLPTSQAKAVFELWQAETVAANTAAQEAETAKTAEGKAALQKEFGQAFDVRQKEIGRLVETYFGGTTAETLKGDGLFRYPELAKGLAKLVEKMAEPGAAGGGSGEAATGDRAMSPAQAKAAVATLKADPVKSAALFDDGHPMHKAVVAERDRLLALADGKEPA